MYCKQCGKQISDDVKFCPRCGAAVGVGTNEANATSRAQITSDAPSTTPMLGGIAEQVNSSKQHSRRRMPMVLIIILVTLALASAAFAAVYIYTTYIAPAQEEQPAQVEPEADENNETAEEPVEEPAEEPEEPDTTSEEQEQRAVYDGILNEYQDSQAQGWSNASESSLSDLSSLGLIVDTQQDMNTGLSYDTLESGTVSYAYTDLGNDGVLDLVIGVVQDDGNYQVIGLFSTDGTTTTSLMNGDITARSWWYVLDDGTILNSGSYGASNNNLLVYTVNLLVYTVVNGQLTPDRSAYMQDGEFLSWNSDPSVQEDPQTAFQEIQNAPRATLDWQPLDEFEPEA